MLRDPLSPEPPGRSVAQEQAREDVSEKTLLTVKEAAALVKLSIGAVYALCNSGTLPHHRLGQGRGAIRIDRQDLLRYVEECRVGAAPRKRSGSPAGSLGTASSAPAPKLPTPGFKHLRVDGLLAPPRPGDGPTSDRGGRSSP